MSDSDFPERYGEALGDSVPDSFLDADEDNHIRRMEGWDETRGDEQEVGRFAVPPYRWFVVPKSAFPARQERETA